jgi:hypothetical protein
MVTLEITDLEFSALLAVMAIAPVLPQPFETGYVTLAEKCIAVPIPSPA